MRSRFGLCWFLTSAIAAAAQATAQSPILESSRWRLELTGRGGVRRLTHKPSGRVVLDAPPGTPTYELAAGKLTEADQSAKVRAERISTARGQGLRFTSEHSGKTVTTEVVEAREHGGIEFRIRILNRGSAPITSIKFPVLIAPRQLGGASDDDVLLLPVLDGGIVENPLQEMPVQPDAHYIYPGPLSCQVVAYYDKTAGLYVAAHDSEGNGKRLGATRLADGSLDLSVYHLQPAIVQPELAVGYAVVVDTFTGDWYTAAGKYRDWSLRQKWSRERLATSRKVPQWIRGGAIVAEYDPLQLDLARQQRWFEQLRDWFQVAPVPNNRGWENGGMWMSPWYLPPLPSPAEFRKSAEVAKETGGRGMIMLSGYRWSLETADGKGRFQSQDEFEQKAGADAQCGPDGKPRIWKRNPTGGWMPAKWARICRASERVRRETLEIARYSVQAGYPVIHWDQENGGNYVNSVCYSKKHGHPPGDGVWIHQGLEKLYRSLWSEIAPLTPDFAASMEQSNELYMPYLTMAQERPFATGRQFPALPPSTQPVPLLMFLHHEHLFGWAAYYPWRTTPDGIFYSLAKGFAAGLMPGLGRLEVEKQQREEKQTWERYLKLFQSCMAGYRGFARDALMYGRMMPPLDIAIPAQTFEFHRQYTQLRNKAVDGLKQSFPSVLNSVWMTADGRTVIVLVNYTSDDHSFVIDLASAPGWSSRARARWLEPLAGKPLAGSKVHVTVPALSLRAIEFPNNRPLKSEWLKESE